MVKVRVKGFAWLLPRQQRSRLLTAQPWVTAVGTKPAATLFFHTVMNHPAPPLCVPRNKVVGMGLKNGEQGWMARESSMRQHLCFQQQAPFARCHYFCDIMAHTWLARWGSRKASGTPPEEKEQSLTLTWLSPYILSYIHVPQYSKQLNALNLLFLSDSLLFSSLDHQIFASFHPRQPAPSRAHAYTQETRQRGKHPTIEMQLLRAFPS